MIACLLAACETPEWRMVHTGLDAGLVSVWGRSSRDVYAVGGNATVLHWDGEGWARVPTGASGDLWWVNGREDGGPIYFGGTNGMILRYDGGAFERMDTPGTGTVFGVWVAADDDVWAVGGFGAAAGFAWHYDGSAWTAVDLPDIGDRGLFKVWGTSPDDVWLVGAMGAMYHWDGSTMSAVDAGTTRTLFTVHVLGDRGVAVGGSSTAALVELDGGAWSDRSPEATHQLFGVWLTPEDAYAVGLYGTIVRHDGEEWTLDGEFPSVPALHAVWADETGAVWAVGGQILLSPLTDGVLLHRGTSAPMGDIEEGS